jgi:hypothetical protein
MQDKGTDKSIQVITIRTSGIILDRVKRTAWATQDSEDRQDIQNKKTVLVQRIKRKGSIKKDS